MSQNKISQFWRIFERYASFIYILTQKQASHLTYDTMPIGVILTTAKFVSLGMRQIVLTTSTEQINQRPQKHEIITLQSIQYTLSNPMTVGD